jgi:hypothetical protein
MWGYGNKNKRVTTSGLEHQADGSRPLEGVQPLQIVSTKLHGVTSPITTLLHSENVDSPVSRLGSLCSCLWRDSMFSSAAL